MPYAAYVNSHGFIVKPQPGWYDQENGIRDDQIVGWAIWFFEDKPFTSLFDRAADLPLTNAQVMCVYYATEKPQLRRAFYTRNVYPIPLTDTIVWGSWAPTMVHDRVTKIAAKGWWPHDGS